MILRRLRSAAVAAALAVPLVIAACSNSPSGPSSADRMALIRARAAWAALGARNYTFVVDTYCYCGVRKIRTTVVDGVPTERVILDNNTPVPPNQFRTIETIDAMLAHIEKAIDQRVAKLEATYDHRGVPQYVQIDYQANAIDEEFGWGVTSLTINP